MAKNGMKARPEKKVGAKAASTPKSASSAKPKKKATASARAAKPTSGTKRSPAPAVSQADSLETFTLDVAIEQFGLPMGGLVDEVRRALARKKRPEATRDDVRRAVESLIAKQKLKVVGRKLFAITTSEEDEDDDFRPRSKVDAPDVGSRCIFPLPNGKKDFAAVTKAIDSNFEVVKKRKEAWDFLSRYTPTAASPLFTLTLGAGDDLDDSVTTSASAYAVLSFADLDAVLDEANGLIEAQTVIQRVTKLPYFLSWNGKRVDPE